MLFASIFVAVSVLTNGALGAPQGGAPWSANPIAEAAPASVEARASSQLEARKGSEPIMRAVPAGVKVPRDFKMPTVAQVAQYKTLLELSLVKSINSTIALSSVLLGSTLASFVAQNPVPAPITVSSVSGIAGVNGTTYVSFNATFNNYMLPPNGTAQSPNFPATLTQGAFGSAPLLSSPTIDLQDANLTLLAYNFIPISLVDITQSKIPFKYTLGI